MIENKDLINTFDQFLKNYLKKRKSDFYTKNSEFKKINQLFNSMEYSIFSGGKRFRPILSLLVAEALGEDPKKALPFAAAVECVHTYSLIHDDLPCMDDDDMRRGQPTNHKKFGEDIALLAGDALLTEAFHLIASHYKNNVGALTLLLTEAIGSTGMIGGQVLDILKLDNEKSKELLDAVHELKTGALIRVSIEGVALSCETSKDTQKALRDFGEHLGFAFQLADDVDDFVEKGKENTNYVNHLGLDSTKDLLKQTTSLALTQLENIPGPTEHLKSMAQFNCERAMHLQ